MITGRKSTSSSLGSTKRTAQVTGPRTTYGKRVSSLNSLTHGLNVNGFLRCKQHRCYFIDMCLYAAVLGKEALREIPYGSPCPVEAAKFDYIVDRLPESNAGEFAMLQIRLDRIRMLSAIQADITREISGRNEMALAYRYRQPLENKLYRLTEELLQ